MGKTIHTELVWSGSASRRHWALANDGTSFLAGHLSPYPVSHFFPDAPNLSPALDYSTASGAAPQPGRQRQSPAPQQPKSHSETAIATALAGILPVCLSYLVAWVKGV